MGGQSIRAVRIADVRSGVNVVPVEVAVGKSMLDRLGPAINSGRGLFLFGAPGNGKTSIAERVTRAFGEYVWIPRAIGVDGDVQTFDVPSLKSVVPSRQRFVFWRTGMGC